MRVMRIALGSEPPFALACGMQGAVPSPLDAPVTCLRGVGPERATHLARLEIRTIRELLLHRPRRYEDRRQIRSIESLQTGDTAAVCGTIVAMGVKTWHHGQRSVFECILEDGTARLHCRWWNLPYMQNYFSTGERLFVYGRVKSVRPRSMDHPETENIDAGEQENIHLRRVVPVYPLTEGIAQRWMRALIFQAIREYAAAFDLPAEPWSDTCRSSQLIQHLHFPEKPEDAEHARRQLALAELVVFQREIYRRRQLLYAHADGHSCRGDNRLVRPFLKQLAFSLTESQTRVLREIRHDLTGPHPMRRLLQGDVGSGKTVVAACCALMVIESGYDVALMAPTELLATQHFATFGRWFDPLGLVVNLITGSRRTASASGLSTTQAAVDRHADARLPRLTIGTHALFEADLDHDRLGLVMIDEQHKFGVVQRERLVRKGHYPHLLVMTATPIPRTLGLTFYGDLDASVIDSLPPGRGKVRTYLRGADRLPKVWAFVREQIAAGRQAYFVYPRVEEDDGDSVKTVVAEARRIGRELTPHVVAILHGQMPSAERDQVMEAFRRGEIAALVASSVIEVGVDVSNATVMVIENADRFGLAQLHQLRGRIGRGAHQSYCVLVADLRRPEARQRLEVLERTSDGFEVAEADLRLRGPGELLGQSQSGTPTFRFADLTTDLNLVEAARQFVRKH
jgi:ATP-dependent DNA helicase RecG